MIEGIREIGKAACSGGKPIPQPILNKILGNNYLQEAFIM